MTSEQIAAIRSTWSLIGATTEVAPVFYAQLFRHDPSASALFRHADMDAQGDKLTHALTMVVRSLDTWSALVPTLEALGRRHAAYGVTDAHYPSVRDALLDTFDLVLGAAMTDAAREAWTAALDGVAAIMCTASHRMANA